MKAFAALIPALSLVACIQPPNPALETLKTAREFSKAAAEAQRANGGNGGNRSPSEEVGAFQRTDARLHYANAAIVRDDGGCSFYQGMTPDGQSARVPLTNSAGQPICRH